MLNSKYQLFSRLIFEIGFPTKQFSDFRAADNGLLLTKKKKKKVSKLVLTNTRNVVEMFQIKCIEAVTGWSFRLKAFPENANLNTLD